MRRVPCEEGGRCSPRTRRAALPPVSEGPGSCRRHARGPLRAAGGAAQARPVVGGGHGHPGALQAQAAAAEVRDSGEAGEDAAGGAGNRSPAGDGPKGGAAAVTNGRGGGRARIATFLLPKRGRPEKQRCGCCAAASARSCSDRWAALKMD